MSSFAPCLQSEVMMSCGKKEHVYKQSDVVNKVGLILGLHQANERRRYFVTTSPIGLVQA